MNEVKSMVQKSMQSQLPHSEQASVQEIPVNDIIAGGQAMMQTKTRYSTAVQVIRPRNLMNVEQRCLQEAAIAGDDFYYSWSQGGGIIEGLSVGAALAIARNFGNCVVDTNINETYNSYVFEATFIDLETGFNLTRAFRQNKVSPKNRKGEAIYSGERGEDIIFQIGQSKAIRNAILNAMPVWLINKILAKSKENVKGKIESMGAEKARTELAKKAAALKVPLERIESIYGKQKSWDTEKLVLISGGLRSIENGHESIDDAFPAKQEGQFSEQNVTVVNGTKVNKSTGEIFPEESTPTNGNGAK